MFLVNLLLSYKVIQASHFLNYFSLFLLATTHIGTFLSPHVASQLQPALPLVCMQWLVLQPCLVESQKWQVCFFFLKMIKSAMIFTFLSFAFAFLFSSHCIFPGDFAPLTRFQILFVYIWNFCNRSWVLASKHKVNICCSKQSCVLSMELHKF